MWRLQDPQDGRIARHENGLGACYDSERLRPHDTRTILLMPKRDFMTDVRLIGLWLSRLVGYLVLLLLLLGPVVIFLLGLAALIGVFAGVTSCFLGDFWIGLILLGVGAGASVIFRLFLRFLLNAPELIQNCDLISDTILFYPLNTEFDN